LPPAWGAAARWEPVLSPRESERDRGAAGYAGATPCDRARWGMARYVGWHRALARVSAAGTACGRTFRGKAGLHAAWRRGRTPPARRGPTRQGVVRPARFRFVWRGSARLRTPRCASTCVRAPVDERSCPGARRDPAPGRCPIVPGAGAGFPGRVPGPRRPDPGPALRVRAGEGRERPEHEVAAGVRVLAQQELLHGVGHLAAGHAAVLVEVRVGEGHVRGGAVHAARLEVRAVLLDGDLVVPVGVHGVEEELNVSPRERPDGLPVIQEDVLTADELLRRDGAVLVQVRTVPDGFTLLEDPVHVALVLGGMGGPTPQPRERPHAARVVVTVHAAVPVHVEDREQPADLVLLERR